MNKHRILANPTNELFIELSNRIKGPKPSFQIYGKKQKRKYHFSSSSDLCKLVCPIANKKSPMYFYFRNSIQTLSD